MRGYNKVMPTSLLWVVVVVLLGYSEDQALALG